MKKAHIVFTFCPSTETERESGVVRLLVRTAHLQHLRAFYKQEGNTTYVADIQVYDGSGTEQLSHFFHEIRDRIADAMGDPSREHKAHLKTMIKNELGYLDGDGELLSTRKYTKAQWMALVDKALWYADQAEADIRDLVPEWREIREKKE